MNYTNEAGRGPRGDDQSDLTQMTAVDALKLLDAEWSEPKDRGTRKVLLEAVQELPQVFQLRDLQGTDPEHVEKLRKIIRDREDVDPMAVIPFRNTFILVDGHHRLDAYRKAGRAGTQVPVWVLAERPSKAVLRAGRVNSRVRLQMTERERCEAAWKLVKLSGSGAATYSKAEIAAAAAVSDRTVANMRATRRKLIAEHPDFELEGASWLHAKATADGRESDWGIMSDEEVQKMVEHFAKQIEKHLGPKFVQNPQVAARALIAVAPRAAGQILYELREELGLADPETDSDF